MERLHVFIEASLKEVGIAYKDLVAIAVSHGPGSLQGFVSVFLLLKACVML
jgi:tRNA threonylcarbamoyladenosine biosynthesis protein TsaB